jgi:hypothetical protein
MHHILEYEDFLADKGLVLEASKKDAKVLNKLIDTNLKNSQEMKKVVGQWKKAEGQEKADLTAKLKVLTTMKQDLEKKIAVEVEQLDKGIGLEVVKEVNEGIDGRMVEIKLKNMKQDLDAVKDFYGDDNIEKAREYLEDVKENITYLLKRMK